jgi:putative ABC transport system permease protein
MLVVTFADLWFRARQFLIAIFGVGLVLALGLSLSGLADGFRAEAAATVNAVGASSWVMSGDAHGRITAFAAFPASDVSTVAGEPGVRRAAAVLFAPDQAVLVSGSTTPQTVNLVGVERGGLGDPAVVAGHPLEGPRQAVVDSSLNAGPGSTIALNGQAFEVVGTVNGRTMTGGTPLVYTPLVGVQQAVVGGKPLVTAVATEGRPTHLPAGLVSLSPSAVVTDTVDQLGSAVSSIDNTRWLMWLVAAAIVASMLYVSALERRRDFAVLKALGSSSATLFFSLVLEAVVVTLLAAVLAEVLATLLRPVFQQTVDITIDARFALPLIAVSVGVIASVSALRRVAGADPATAFG